MTLYRNQGQGHCPRPLSYKENSIQIDLSDFENVIKVERVDKNSLPSHLKSISNDIIAVADVEALISFEKLVDFLLPNGMIPAVVPEFKGITIGGSIQV